MDSVSLECHSIQVSDGRSFDRIVLKMILQAIIFLIVLLIPYLTVPFICLRYKSQ